MDPVEQLNPSDALAELVELADARPPEEEVLERIKWDRRHLERYRALEAWLQKKQSNAGTNPWTDCDTVSLHRDGHRVALYRSSHTFEWWATPAGQHLVRGPFPSRRSAKASLDVSGIQAWTTPQLDISLGAVDPSEEP